MAEKTEAQLAKDRDDAAQKRLADAQRDSETYALEALTAIVRDANTNLDQRSYAAATLLQHAKA